MSNLFAAANQAAGPKPLVSFRAGKMVREGSLVKPDKRKGLISLVHSDDTLIHFQWRDRHSGSVEEDLVIFPDEAVFTRVEKCTTGRVYMLDFKGTGRQLFYWLQEPSTEKDEENCQKVNQFMNHPPPFRGGATPEPAPGAPPSLPRTAGNASTVLGQMDRNQLMGILAGLSSGGGGGAGGSPTAADIAALQNVLRGFGETAPAGGGNQGSSALRPPVPSPATAGPALTPVSLHHVVDAADIAPAVQANAEEFVSRLLEHLPPIPEGVTREQHLLDNLRSSQLQQTVALFDSALSDPQAFSEIMTSFQLQPAPGAPPFGTKAFLDAIAHSAARNRSQENATATTAQPKPEEAKPDPKLDDKMEE
eukprot:GGOE01036569.1.p1 GENE.GGOE01036569.1~~GGOE01036569.1.p1  ORF type:complete len:371 (+),score=107.88 GGOE01036569.1:22-1113(+)